MNGIKKGQVAGGEWCGENQTIDTPACLPSFIHSTDPQSDVARARSWAAIYVQDFDAPCVLQFAWISALCCALHRSTSQVIHRSGSYDNDNDSSPDSRLRSLRLRSEKESVCAGIVPINSRTRVFWFLVECAAGDSREPPADTLSDFCGERRTRRE